MRSCPECRYALPAPVPARCPECGIRAAELLGEEPGPVVRELRRALAALARESWHASLLCLLHLGFPLGLLVLGLAGWTLPMPGWILSGLVLASLGVYTAILLRARARLKEIALDAGTAPAFWLPLCRRAVFAVLCINIAAIVSVAVAGFQDQNIGKAGHATRDIGAALSIALLKVNLISQIVFAAVVGRLCGLLWPWADRGRREPVPTGQWVVLANVAVIAVIATDLFEDSVPPGYPVFRYAQDAATFLGLASLIGMMAWSSTLRSRGNKLWEEARGEGPALPHGPAASKV